MSNHKLQAVRGTKDLFGEEINLFNHIVEVAKNKAKIFSFEELQTPIFEFSEIFERNLGETSDIISKETNAVFSLLSFQVYRAVLLSTKEELRSTFVMIAVKC